MEKTILRKGESRTLTIQGESLESLDFYAHIINNAVNVANTTTTIDWSKIIVNAKIYQGGQVVPIHTGDCRAIDFIAAMQNSKLGDLGVPNSKGVVITKHGASTKAVNAVPLSIPLGGVVLKGNDKIEVSITVGDNAFDSAVSNDSFIVFYTKPAITNQTETVVYQKFNIETDQEVFAKAIGDDVTGVWLLNYDKTTPNDGDKIFTDVELFSDRLETSKNFEDMVIERFLQYPYQKDIDHDGFLQSFTLLDQEVDNLRVKLQLNTSNIATGKNVLFVRRFVANPIVAQKALARNQRHARKKLSKRGLV